MADDDKKTANDDKTEEEGFDLEAALDGVRQATKTVKIYLDATAADEAFRLNGALLEARADAKDGVEQVMSIAEEAPTVRLERELKEAIAALDERAMTFHLRALASKEMDVIRNVVVNKVKAPRNQNEEAANERGRAYSTSTSCRTPLPPSSTAAGSARGSASTTPAGCTRPCPPPSGIG